MIDVGVISGRGMLTSAQRGSLGRQLQLIGNEHRGHLMILHHGCGHDADEAAHRTVRALGNWRIHGHPASEQQDGEVLLRQGVIRGLNRIHESKPPRQRDADIVDTSEILIVVRDRRPQPELEAAVKRAEAASLRVIYITEGANARTPSSREPDRPHKPSPAAARKNPAWAERQGHEDAIAGRPCRKYKTFLSTYKLDKSDASLQLWNAYCKKAQQASVNTAPPKPKQKPRWTRCPTLSNRHAPRRKAVRRYDNVERRRDDLSPKNAALLMKVNQQNTLVDSWR